MRVVIYCFDLLQNAIVNIYVCFFQESEDLRERMMTMEAELRALRDELSNRSSLASNTSSQATIKEKDDNSIADSGENTNAASAAVVDNPTEVVKKEDSISEDGCGPSEAKKAKKEDVTEVQEQHDPADAPENKNNSKTTTITT